MDRLKPKIFVSCASAEALHLKMLKMIIKRSLGTNSRSVAKRRTVCRRPVKMKVVPAISQL